MDGRANELDDEKMKNKDLVWHIQSQPRRI